MTPCGVTGAGPSPIGIVGLGNMGAPMARRLAGAGHALVLYDLRPEVLETLVDEEGAVVAAKSLPDLGRACEIVITMLPDAAAVKKAVLREAGGLAQDMSPGGLVIDMSSSAPRATVALGEELAGRGLALIDAPVSGGVPRARDGSLTIMAGGPAELIDSVEPILSAMGRVLRTGALGSGHAAKALNNYVSAAGLVAVSEALIVAERFGLDPHLLNRVLDASTGRNNTTERKVEPFMLSRSFDSGFALDLLCKDVAMARDLSRELGLDAPGLEACSALLDAAARSLGTAADHTAAFAYLEERLAGK